jgi:hypothetical protein
MSLYTEGFTSVNPIPAPGDIDSTGALNADGTFTKTPSPPMQKVINFIKNYKWNTPLEPNQENRLADSIRLFYAFNVSHDKLNTLVAGYTTRPSFEQVVKDANKLMKNPMSDNAIANIIQNSQTSNNLSIEMVYAAYIYIFGDTSSAPATSTTVTIPSPCKKGTRSIPGGYVETKCFDFK